MSAWDRALWTCPVDGCGPPAWVLTMAALVYRTPVTAPPGLTLADIDAAVSETARVNVEGLRAQIREHLVTHDVLDFLGTIERLASDLVQHDSGIRPHLSRRDEDVAVERLATDLLGGRLYRGPIF